MSFRHAFSRNLQAFRFPTRLPARQVKTFGNDIIAQRFRTALRASRMTLILRAIFPVIFTCILLTPVASAAPDASELLMKMDDVIRGKSHDMTLTLDVVTPRWKRSYDINVKMKGVDYAMARVLSPSKVEGQGFLRIESRLWNYLPTAERVILIPTSMMLDNFMGSDFSNDDFVKLSYLPRDYDAVITGEETMDGFEVYHLNLTPRPDAPVTYGKLEVWLRVSDAAPVQWVFYNEDMEKIRTLHYSGFKTFSGREIPTVWHMKDHKEDGEETTITITEAEYDLDIPDSLFTKEKLEQYP